MIFLHSACMKMFYLRMTRETVSEKTEFFVGKLADIVDCVRSINAPVTKNVVGISVFTYSTARFGSARVQRGSYC